MGSNGRTDSNATVVLKPLFNACLTGKLHGLYDWCRQSITNDFAQSALKKQQQQQKSLWKRNLFCRALCSMASLGTYEILTDRLKHDNEGRPLSIYQEACCGLISGYTTMLVWQPFELACSRVGIHNLTYTNWFTTLAHIPQNEGLSTLWRGSFFNMSRSAAGFMGMLASYDRSRNYFIQTEGLSKWKAHICGSIVSGFFSAASSHSVHYVGFITNAVQTGKLAYSNIPRTVCAVVTPNSGYHFYTNFLYRFHHATAFCVIQYGIYEGLRGVDWTK